MVGADLIEIVDILLGETLAIVGNIDPAKDAAFFIPEEARLLLKPEIDGNLARTSVDRICDPFTDHIPRSHAAFVVFGNELLEVNSRHDNGLMTRSFASKCASCVLGIGLGA